MKKLIVLILALFLAKISFSQYPNGIQTLGNDSNLVQAKGGLKGRIIVYSYADTTAANLERIKQYAGAMIYTTGVEKLYYRNTAASAWVELGSSSGGVNIYNSDGTLTGDRSLYGDNRNLDFTDIGTFTMNADRVSLNTYNSALVSLQDSSVRLSGDTIALNAFNQNIVTILKDSSRSIKRISYTSNLGSTFTRHTLVDKNYVDSLKNIIPTFQQVLTSGSDLSTSHVIDVGTNDFEMFNANSIELNSDIRFQISADQNVLQLVPDSTTSSRKIVYTGNINGTLTTPNSLITRSLGDSLYGNGGSGSSSNINTFADLTTSIVDEEGFYNGFPWPIMIGSDTIMVVVKHSTTHADTGSARYYKSWNGGRSWSTGTDISVNGTRIAISAYQFGIFNGRITMAYTEDTYDTLKFAYSDNGGVSFTSAGSYAYTAGFTGSPSIQPMFTIASDTIYSAQYELASTSRGFLLYSADNGVSWQWYSDVLTQAGGAFPNGLTSEWYCIPTELGQFDRTTKMAALFRNEDYGYYTFVSTTNGFATSTEDVTNLMYEFGPQVARAPVSMINLNQTIYIICGNRRVDQPFGIEYVTIPAASFYTNTQSAYSKIRSLYSATAFTKAADIDFGYPIPYTYNEKPYITFYDVSPVYHSAGEGGDDDVRSVNFPLLDRGYSTKYNDANQSITDSTQTLVSFPDLLLDCMGSWKWDGETRTGDSVWTAIEDGWYMVNAIATFEANGTGSYRQMYVIVVDPGVNTTATNQMISKTTIPGNSSISDFNRLECNGMAYIKQGEQVKVYVKHDATSALNLLNTSRETMATVKITLVR